MFIIIFEPVNNPYVLSIFIDFLFSVVIFNHDSIIMIYVFIFVIIFLICNYSLMNDYIFNVTKIRVIP